jgi:acyl-coenzyme A synthetase/AMP-(fatty) acid ligase
MISGHRIGTAEVENAINEHPHVMESAVVGCPHPIKGQGIAAFAIVEEHKLTDKALADEIRGLVRQQIGAIASPDALYIVPGLPKTRSGKIMRRLLRNVAESRGRYRDCSVCAAVKPITIAHAAHLCCTGLRLLEALPSLELKRICMHRH